MIRLIVIVSLLVGSFAAYAAGGNAIAAAARIIKTDKVAPKKEEGRSLKNVRSNEAIVKSEKDSWLERARITDGINSNKVSDLAAAKEDVNIEVLTTEQYNKVIGLDYVKNDSFVGDFLYTCTQEGMGPEANANLVKIMTKYDEFTKTFDGSDPALVTAYKMKAIGDVIDGLTEDELYRRAANLSKEPCNALGLGAGTVSKEAALKAFGQI